MQSLISKNQSQKIHEANYTLQAINEIKSAWRSTFTVTHAFFHFMVPKNNNNFPLSLCYSKAAVYLGMGKYEDF
jgi:Zn-dependent peptidase ImmA (M78 family)